MKRIIPTVFAAVPAFLTSTAGAVNIYMLASGQPASDQTIAAALTTLGHTVTIGVEYPAFDGTVSLAGFDTVYLQCNANWSSGGLMPQPGQQQLTKWVNAGGRLVTSEWVIYYSYSGGGKFQFLEPILPALNSFNYGGVLQATYTQVTPDPGVNTGLPASFDFPLTSFTGTETYTSAKSAAITYYTTSNGTAGVGLCGWRIGQGSVFSFTSTCGPDQVLDSDFGRLFSNVMAATPAATVCYANCDTSTGTPVLTANDFQCFLDMFAAGLSAANCDGSTGTPSLTANDFQCFLDLYAVGCP